MRILLSLFFFYPVFLSSHSIVFVFFVFFFTAGEGGSAAAPPIEVKHVMRALEHIVAASSGAAEEITGGGIERLAAQAGASDADAVNAERAHVAQMRHALAMKQGKIDELAARVAAQSTEVSPSRPGSAARWKSKARELATALKMSRALLRTRDVATPSSAGAASTPARATALLATPAAAPGSAAGVSESARGSHSVPAADVDALRAVALLLGVIHLVVKSHFHTVNQRLLAWNQGGLVSVEEKPLNEEEQKRRKKRERERE